MNLLNFLYQAGRRFMNFENITNFKLTDNLNAVLRSLVITKIERSQHDSNYEKNLWTSVI